MKFNAKSRNVILVVALVIIALAFFYFNDNKPLAVGTTPNLCSGGSVLSITPTITLVDGGDLNKKVIRVTYSTIPNAECLHIQLNPSQIENGLANSGTTNFDAQKSILGEIQITKSQKIYNINERSTEIYKKFNIINSGWTLLGYCTDDKCRTDNPSLASNLISSPIDGSNGCKCAFDDPKGINGEFASSTNYVWSSTIKIGDYTPLELYSNSATSKLSGTIGTVAAVKWAGNMVGNVNLESINNRNAYKPYSDNKWRMTDSVYQYLSTAYSSKRADLFSCDTGFADSTYCINPLSAARIYNSDFDTKTSNKLSSWVTGESLVKSANITSNQLIVDLKTPIVYPTFTMDIDAASVGIFLSFGEPKVTCPSNIPQLVSGQTQDVSLLIKNAGINSGSIDYSLSCNKGSQTITPSPPQNIAAGSTLTLTGRLGLTVVEGIDTASCTFTATDTNSQLYGVPKTDSCTFSYSSQHQSQCILGTKTCEMANSQLWTCRSDGGYDKQTCQYGCESFENTYRCRQTSGCTQKSDCPTGYECKSNACTKTNEDCAWYDVFCQLKKLNELLTIIKWIVLAIAVLTSFFVSKNLVQTKIIKNRKDRPFAILIALLFSAAIGVALYTILLTALFWYIVIGYILLMIILNFTGIGRAYSLMRGR